MENLFRFYPCSARCGRFIPIPYNVAKIVMKPNGNLLGFIVCEKCSEWLVETIENAHLFRVRQLGGGR